MLQVFVVFWTLWGSARRPWWLKHKEFHTERLKTLTDTHLIYLTAEISSFLLRKSGRVDFVPSLFTLEWWGYFFEASVDRRNNYSNLSEFHKGHASTELTRGNRCTVSSYERHFCWVLCTKDVLIFWKNEALFYKLITDKIFASPCPDEDKWLIDFSHTWWQKAD